MSKLTPHLSAGLAGLALLLGSCSDRMNEQVNDALGLTAEPEPAREAGALWTDPTTGMEFLWLPPGEYVMGCAAWASSCQADEGPAHVVAVEGFWLGRYEVTQGQWQTVTGANPSHFATGSLHPVENVSWTDVQRFIEALNAKGEAKFRLPTEAEWEYACRSGGKQEMFGGAETPEPVAWYGAYFGGNTEATTHEVGQRQPNALGYYDMLGNVAEWVADTYDPAAYKEHDRVDPVIRSDGPNRVFRGGSWEHPAETVRCLTREFAASNDGNYNRGFRLVRQD